MTLAQYAFVATLADALDSVFPGAEGCDAAGGEGPVAAQGNGVGAEVLPKGRLHHPGSEGVGGEDGGGEVAKSGGGQEEWEGPRGVPQGTWRVIPVAIADDVHLAGAASDMAYMDAPFEEALRRNGFVPNRTKEAVWCPEADTCLLYTSPSPRDRG